MINRPPMKIATTLLVILTSSLIILQNGDLSLAAAASSNECTTGVSYECPNCGGISVNDCLDCNGFLNTDEKHGMCFQRKLFNSYDESDNHEEHYHYLWNDIIGTIIWFLAAGVATACGVGGGGIYVPLGILLLQFASKPSSGLSQASIFGASLGGLMLNLQNTHPNGKIREDLTSKKENTSKDDPEEVVDLVSDKEYLQAGHKYFTRPLIDYDMALFLAPMEMAGAVLGVLIQKLMPNWLYLMLASIILAFTSFKTYKKFFAANAKEKEERDKQQTISDETGKGNSIAEYGHSEAPTMLSSESEVTSVKNSSEESVVDVTEITEVEKNEQHSDTEELKLRRQFLEEDSRQYPKEKLVALLILWVGLVLLTFFKGGKGVDSLLGITCESPWYAVLILSQFLWTIGFAAIFGRKLIKRQLEREAVKYPYLPNDVLWNSQKLRFYSSFTFMAGVVAGLIGIGGGMVLGPLMLVMNIHPRVSSATTATMIVLTSSSVAIMFVISGLVPWSYAVYFFCVCFFGAVVGKSKIDGIVKKTGKASILIGILAIIIAFATLGCIVIMFLRLAKNDWCLDGFKTFCDVSEEGSACNGAGRLLDFLENVY